ncbi:DUF998 domain-containing protein [Spirillospora sp. NPDC048911]|uniref:DUF998 domain-containing protein n=1 Tax=Spirillospora sp. NPDC048911 TaxID=3364527 RepID=UPI00371FA0BA
MDFQSRMLLWCGAIAGPLFTLAYLVEGAARAHYDPLRHPVSSLALTDRGWIQASNFLLAAVLTFAFGIGLRRASRPRQRGRKEREKRKPEQRQPEPEQRQREQGRGRGREQRQLVWGPLLIVLWGAGLLGAAIFVTDPISGYPTGTPDRLPEPTTHGALHDYLSLAGFAALAAACLVFARSGPRPWRFYSALSGLGFVAAMLLASATFGTSGDLSDLAGLFQRIAITTAWSWQTLLALRFLTNTHHDETTQFAPE